VVPVAAPPVADLVSLHRLLSRLDPEGPPAAIAVCGAPQQPPRRVVALPGSFNPPHVAHLALLAAGMAATAADAGYFVLSVRTVDKERVGGMLLEDRLWLLCHLDGDLHDLQVTSPAGRPAPVTLGAVATNRGLYVDQAEALSRLAPGAAPIVFVVGFDKIVQVFDPRYYDDRTAALDRLFDVARFLVAPRDDATTADLEALLDRSENRPYAFGVRPLPVDEALADVSSTQVRRGLAAGRAGAVDDVLPLSVARFVETTGCYEAPDGQGRYGERVAALGALTSRTPTG
jgi:nicotinic acid mononucleotide adenylyltransferase